MGILRAMAIRRRAGLNRARTNYICDGGEFACRAKNCFFVDFRRIACDLLLHNDKISPHYRVLNCSD